MIIAISSILFFTHIKIKKGKKVKHLPFPVKASNLLINLIYSSYLGDTATRPFPFPSLWFLQLPLTSKLTLLQPLTMSLMFLLLILLWSFLPEAFLLLCIQTLNTRLLTPTSLQKSWVNFSSALFIFQPSLSAKDNIFSFCSCVNFVLDLFFPLSDEFAASTWLKGGWCWG